MIEITVAPGDSGRRLDKFLAAFFKNAPRSLLYKWLRKKKIKLNGGKAEGAALLRAGDNIWLYLSDETIASCLLSRPEVKAAKGIDVLFEDENVLIVNKPVGLLTHGEAADDTLIDRVLFHLRDQIRDQINETFTPALCNRLDRNTSGIVVCGKNYAALRTLNQMFAQDRVVKEYLALVCGFVSDEALQRAYLKKDPYANQATIVAAPCDGGKEILTEYRPIGYGQKCTLLRVRLITGRSHQIRAHMQAIGHPVLGDPKYGDTEMNAWLSGEHHIRSQLLHAEKITFFETEGVLGRYGNQSFTAPPPRQFQNFIRAVIRNER